MSKLKVKESQVVTPTPFFKIKFGCSNRNFYAVKNDLCSLAEKVGVEVGDCLEEWRDADGDLDTIRMYNTEQSRGLVYAVFAWYGVPISDLPEEMDVVLSIF